MLQKGDITLAFKAICLHESLSGLEKRVGCALLDHFNRRTGRCDPSLDTISKLLRISRRSVIRAVNRLATIGLFTRVRHGGLSQRNQYSPAWNSYRSLEQEWRRVRAAHRDRFYVSELAPHQGQERHEDGAEPGTQTCLSNYSFLTSPAELAGHANTSRNQELHRRSVVGTVQGSHDAAWEAARRRWDTDLLRRYASSPNVYSLIVEGVDAALAELATDREKARPGSGCAFIVDQLRARGAMTETMLTSTDGGSDA